MYSPWLRRIVIAPLIALVTLILIGTLYQSVATEQDARTYQAPGRLVDVGGYRLHLVCLGDGDPTVLLEAGLGSNSVSWTWVRDGVSRFTRVCAYDRAGYGWSDPSPRPRTAEVIAEELHTLLTNAGEGGPFVLAAHSFGGIPARVFAARYPDDVAGVVLVDASHPAQFSTACVPACLPQELVSRSEALYQYTPWLASAGVLRFGSWLGLLPFQAAARGLPPRETSIVVAELATNHYWGTSAAEFHEFSASAAQAAAAGSLGDRPLRVVTAGNTYYAGELAALTGHTDPRQVTASWLTLQRDLARLSRRSQSNVVREAAHVSLLTDPHHAASVVEAIAEVVRDTKPQ